MAPTSQSCWIFHFQVNSIQRYVFESGRLAEMVGASDLIEHLVTSLFDSTVKTLGIISGKKEESVIRQAGAAIILQLQTRQDAILLRDVWSLVVRDTAPGLLFTQSVCTAESLDKALDKSHDCMNKARSQPSISLPIPGPVIARAPRTGNAAVDLLPIKRDRHELADAATKAKRRRRFRQGEALTKRFLGKLPAGSPAYVFPRNMEPDEEDAFPFSSQNHYVAVVHIDGNGFGEHLMRLAAEKNGASTARQFSRLMTEVNLGAASKALENAVLKPWRQSDWADADGKLCVPFRPLVLGGDDLTVIVSADYALDFVNEFIRYFEDESESQLKNLESSGRPSYLTACAGVAFVNSSQPFYLAYELAESLCSFAKSAARGCSDSDAVIPSAMAFHRITSSFIADYDTALREELTAHNPIRTTAGLKNLTQESLQQDWQLTLGAYSVGRAHRNLPKWQDLRTIVRLFEDDALNSGPLRNFLTLLHSDREEAQQAYRRWSKNMQERHPTVFDAYQEAVMSIYQNDYADKTMPFAKLSNGPGRTFLGDLLNVCAAQGEVHGR